MKSIKSLYGFTKPYNFERALPFVVALLFLFLIFGVMGTMAVSGKLTWGTYRLVFFLYVGSMALAAAALSFAPRWAWLLIALCFLEFSLAFSTSALVKLNILTQSLLPADTRLSSPAPQFKYHPLLQATPAPNFSHAFPVLRGGKLVPTRFEHDSQGLRGPERNQERLKQQIVIAALGGSTTYGVAIANGETYPDALERKLGSDYAVLNHGGPGYTTAENIIQTLFYLDSYGVRPRCAIYYVGWNDIRNAHLPNLDPGYADFHLLSQWQSLKIRKTTVLTEVSPLGRILIRNLQAWLDPVPFPPNLDDRAPEQGGDARLERIYRSNLEAIFAINKQRGITTIFVGQILNRAQLQDTRRSEWLPLVRDSDTWPLQARFNVVLKETADALGSLVFIPPVEAFQNSDFMDQGHFSPAGSEKFSAMLAPLVMANCRKN